MVELNRVTKYYGTKRALGPVTFRIEEGRTVGFLGLNGVGKTTLLKILACGLRPSSGKVTVGGVDVLEDPRSVRKRVGYLPETPPVYGDMPVREYLSFVGRVKGLSREAVRARVPEVEKRARISEVSNVPTRHLSQGYRQRVGVAQAIVHNPDLLILDEPTHDLDPVQIMEMRAMIQDLKDSHTILISSHILPEISETCDRLVILHDGRIVASGTEAELGRRLTGTKRILVEVALREPGDASKAEEALRGISGVSAVLPEPRGSGAESVAFTVESSEDARGEACRVLVAASCDVIGLRQSKRKLEQVFVDLVGEEAAVA